MKKCLFAFCAVLLFFTASCPFPLVEENKTTKKTTIPPSADEDILIMVYLDADNDLEAYGLDDMNEMEAVNLEGTGIKVIVLIDRIPGYTAAEGDWSNTRLYEIKYDSNGYNSTLVSTRLAGMGLTAGGNEELNMGDPDTLSGFIDFCKSYYPADNYVLDLWNHGGGWRSTEDKPVTKAVCWDKTSSNDSLYTSELRSAVTGKGLSLIGFDACLMGMVEVAYELRNCAQIMVASEETEPGDGWDYVSLLNRYKSSDLSMNAMADSIADSYAAFYNFSAATMSAIDLSKMGNLSTALTNFANYLTGVSSSELITARTNTLNFNYNENVDLYDFAEKFSSVQATALKTAVADSVIYNWSGSGVGSHGLAIYFPTASTDSSYSYAVQLSSDCTWITFLNVYAAY